MSDITGAISPMNDVEIAANAPITEALELKFGANINALISGSKFTVEAFTANGTWTVLSATAIVCGWGGGGGGSSGAGYGGAGAAFGWRILTGLVVGATHSVTIGAGGTAGGGTGGTTSLGTLASFLGGGNGVNATAGGAMGGAPSTAGQNGISYAGGAGNYVDYGGGGGGPGGVGAASASSAGANGASGAANTGAGGGSGSTGGAGGSGKLFVISIAV